MSNEIQVFPALPESYRLFRSLEIQQASNGYVVVCRLPARSLGMAIPDTSTPTAFTRHWGRCRLVYLTIDDVISFCARYLSATPQELDDMADVYYCHLL